MQKFILVTGASSGIGQYIAHKYASSENYAVFAIDIIPSDNRQNFTFFKADLKEESPLAEIFSKIPRIDLAINCAGVSGVRKELSEFSALEITNCWQDNFLPAFNSLKNEITIMKRSGGGKIINIASITGHIGMKNFLAYSTAKASIINMTKVAAIEQAANNIKINSISPATIDTPMIRKKYNGGLKDYSDIYYTRNCGTVSDIYYIVKMLEENNFMTGNDIKIDGGLTDLFRI
jgi:NAD(P)-dependent dehydrogenase (short-subunit alcohol dehydrogenase family)